MSVVSVRLVLVLFAVTATPSVKADAVQEVLTEMDGFRTALGWDSDDFATHSTCSGLWWNGYSLVNKCRDKRAPQDSSDCYCEVAGAASPVRLCQEAHGGVALDQLSYEDCEKCCEKKYPFALVLLLVPVFVSMWCCCCCGCCYFVAKRSGGISSKYSDFQEFQQFRATHTEGEEVAAAAREEVAAEAEEGEAEEVG